jgi:hypothetical protein
MCLEYTAMNHFAKDLGRCGSAQTIELDSVQPAITPVDDGLQRRAPSSAGVQCGRWAIEDQEFTNVCRFRARQRIEAEFEA